MSLRMSCALTTDAVLERRKTVTRRHVDTWHALRVGDRLTLIEKGMGLPKGARQVVLAEVEIVDVRVEPLTEVWTELGAVEAEGVEDMSPNLFAYWWAESHGYGRRRTPAELADIKCRRIEWRYIA
jgi:hypothetical protein